MTALQISPSRWINTDHIVEWEHKNGILEMNLCGGSFVCVEGADSATVLLNLLYALGNVRLGE